MKYIVSYNVFLSHFKEFESMNYVGAFCESLRRINYDGKVIMFTESIERMKPYVHGLDVTLELVDPIYKRCTEDPTYPLGDYLDDVSFQRLYVYKRYFEENNISDEDIILFLDSRDTVFQCDPFNYLKNPDHLTFSEEPVPMVNSWSLKQFQIYSFDWDVSNCINDYKGNSINSNCIGKIKHFKQLVNDITKDVNYIRTTRTYPHTPICDQVMMNKLFIYNKLNYVSILPHSNNLIISQVQEGQYEFKDGIVYVNDNPVSILHQYDRNPNIFKSLLTKYSI